MENLSSNPMNSAGCSWSCSREEKYFIGVAGMGVGGIIVIASQIFLAITATLSIVVPPAAIFVPLAIGLTILTVSLIYASVMELDDQWPNMKASR